MPIKIEIERDGSMENITPWVLVRGCNLSYKFGTDEFMYAPDVFDLSLNVKAVDVINFFLGQHLPVPILVSDSETNLIHFNGYVKPSNEVSIADELASLNLDCVDRINLDLEAPCPKLVEIDTDLQTIASKICDNVGLQTNFPCKNVRSNCTLLY